MAATSVWPGRALGRPEQRYGFVLGTCGDATGLGMTAGRLSKVKAVRARLYFSGCLADVGIVGAG